MTVNNGYSAFTSFCNFLEKAGVISSTCNSVFFSGGSVSNATSDPKMSKHKPVSPSLSDSVKGQYAIGQSLSLVRDGHCEHVVLESVDLDMDQMIPYFTVKLSNGLTAKVTKDFLRHVDDKDVSFIPVTSAEIQDQAAHINPELLQALLKPTNVTPLMSEFLDLHDRLRHMPFPVMFKLCQEGKLDKKFLALQSARLLCPSCIFWSMQEDFLEKGFPSCW